MMISSWCDPYAQSSFETSFLIGSERHLVSINLKAQIKILKLYKDIFITSKDELILYPKEGKERHLQMLNLSG